MLEEGFESQEAHRSKEGHGHVGPGKRLRKPIPQETMNDQKTSPHAGNRATARHLFNCWPQVARAVRSAPSLALFLDLDGTMVPLRRLPSDVKPLDLSLRRVLRRLATHKNISVHVISGRNLPQLRRLVPVRGLHLLGLHGWEGRAVPPLVEEGQLLRKAKHLLGERHLHKLGVWLEDKGLALAVHYRSAPLPAIPLARAIVRDVLKNLGPQIHMLRGHKVWELLPRQITGKGSAILDILSALPKPTLAVFVGDDVTDEAAFKALPRGVTVRVGENRRTRARFHLRNPEEVKEFLLKLEEDVNCRPGNVVCNL
jgi:trehalose 6-phosphate phosphatase